MIRSKVEKTATLNLIGLLVKNSSLQLKNKLLLQCCKSSSLKGLAQLVSNPAPYRAIYYTKCGGCNCYSLLQWPKIEDDAALVLEFISQDLNHRRLQNKSLSDLATSIAYNRLADLLRLIKDEKVLDIILDKKRNSEVKYMVNDLRQFSFQGSWLDSIEKLFVNNLHDDVSSLVKLEDHENQLCKEHRFLNKWVEFWTSKLEQSKAGLAAINKRNLHTTKSSYASQIIEIEKIPLRVCLDGVIEKF
ncbi:hypothetical protein MTR_1g025670 [Medicago truncatula]|uniref:Uncharacterized protein n=1 Tax=Medicago truncatula TaxID=3880 RepID=G7I7S4_MEDTR|nr:hypothetical protein MTR_1g025670 [Medicago truncatula]